MAVVSCHCVVLITDYSESASCLYTCVENTVGKLLARQVLATDSTQLLRHKGKTTASNVIVIHCRNAAL